MNRIRELRKGQGRTIAELAMRLGVTESTLRNWERGRHLPKSAAMRRKVARVLGVSEAILALEADTTAAPVHQEGSKPIKSLKPLAAAIIARGNRVLLTERRFHTHGELWSWPSGQVEQGESLQDAMLRQMHHELLLDHAEIIRQLGDIDLATGYRMTHFQVVIPEDAEPTLNDYEQLSQIQWMTREEAEQAFKTLDPAVAQKALSFIDEVLAHDASTTPRRTPSRVTSESPQRMTAKHHDVDQSERTITDPKS